jgi:hypothetical protein
MPYAVYCDEPTSIHLGYFRDIQIKRAISWIEALIDSHFPALTLAVSYDGALHDSNKKFNFNVSSAFRRGISCLLDTLSLVDSVIDEMEDLVGIWNQINSWNRQLYTDQRSDIGPSCGALSSLYQSEMLHL